MGVEEVEKVINLGLFFLIHIEKRTQNYGLITGDTEETGDIEMYRTQEELLNRKVQTISSEKGQDGDVWLEKEVRREIVMDKEKLLKFYKKAKI